MGSWRVMSSPYATAEYKRNRKIVLEAANWTCHYCGNPANEADHILPVSLGGSNEVSNLLPCCKQCNSGRGNQTMKRLNYWNKRYS
ncbi:MAG: HNH endonuclease [bacterium]